MLKVTFIKNKKFILTILIIAALYLYRTILSWYEFVILGLAPNSDTLKNIGILTKDLVWITLTLGLLKWWYPKNWLATAGFKTFNWKTFVWLIVATTIPLIYFYLQDTLFYGGINYKPNWTFSLVFYEIRNSLVEESLFRGFIQTFLNDNLGFWKGIIVQGFLFSVIHWCWWVFTGELSFGSAMYVWVLGIFWGFIRQKSGSIYPTLVSHAVHNLVLTMLL
ncbi:MAG: type II CAAX endopeptidase family protein [bacterium]